MKALITGASSGIGLDIARYLATKGYELILVSRNKEKLEQIQEHLPTKVTIIVADLSIESKVKELYVLCKSEKIDILINNAGFGDCGEFMNAELSKDLEMINLNIKAVHILTKLFLKDMKKRNQGYILNVASMAAFSPGPLMATYYATKSYVMKLTASIYEELRAEKSNIVISCLCPGPIKTNFLNVANVKFAIGLLDSRFVAEYAIEKLFEKKLIIIPGFKMKIVAFFAKISPLKLAARIAYKIQKRKVG